MKVLHIIQGFGGGVSSLVKNLVLHEDTTRISQDVLSFAYTNGEAFTEALTAHGSRVMQMPRPRKDGYGAFKKAVLAVMKDGGYDVVHCHTDGWRSTIFRKLARKAGIRLFCIHAHRSTNDLSRIKNHPWYLKLNRRISRKNADIRFACGEKAAAFIYGTAENAVIVPNGIDPQIYREAAATDRAALKAALGISEEAVVILHAGRLVTAKNHGFLIETARALRDNGTPFVMLLAGAGELEAVIRQSVEDHGLTACVRLLGRRNDVPTLMAIADVMVLPSLSEGLPTVAVEAQAMGLHSLLSDTITTECDLGLGLVRFLPIGASAPLWAQEIAQLRGVGASPSEEILQQLEERTYTAEAAVRYYTDVLENALQTKQRGTAGCD